MSRLFVSGALIVVFLALSVWVVAFSDTFQDCVASKKGQSTQSYLAESAPQFQSAFDLRKHCAGEFMEKNGEAVTAFFTIVLAVSTIFLWAATRDAARGGERAANIAEQALVSLERPFVFMKEVNLFVERGVGPMGTTGQNLPGAPVNYRLSATLENSGQTPAVRAVYNFNCGHVSAQNIPTFDFPDQGQPRRGTIGPKAILVTMDRVISPAAMTQIELGVDRWFIWGWVDYDDIFQDTKRHRTEYCLELVCRRLPDGQLHIGFTPYGSFNAADDDCLRTPQPYQ